MELPEKMEVVEYLPQEVAVEVAHHNRVVVVEVLPFLLEEVEEVEEGIAQLQEQAEVVVGGEGLPLVEKVHPKDQ